MPSTAAWLFLGQGAAPGWERRSLGAVQSLGVTLGRSWPTWSLWEQDSAVSVTHRCLEGAPRTGAEWAEVVGLWCPSLPVMAREGSEAVPGAGAGCHPCCTLR